MRNNAAYLPENPIVYIIFPESIHNRASLHIFVDKSSIEIFANDGKDVFTLLTYPGEAQTGIELFAQKKGTKMELDAWMLKSIWR